MSASEGVKEAVTAHIITTKVSNVCNDWLLKEADVQGISVPQLVTNLIKREALSSDKPVQVIMPDAPNANLPHCSGAYGCPWKCA